EGVAIADVNKDGQMDVLNGEAWYEAPSWKLHPIRKLSDYGNGAGGYSHSFANWAHDLNGDGWTDLICIDFPGVPCCWFEIPQGGWEGPAKEKLGQGQWEFHPHFLTPDGKEGHLAAADLHVDDLDLDGDNDIMMSSAHARGVWWFENTGTNAEPKFEYRIISDAVSQTHALHYIDIN